MNMESDFSGSPSNAEEEENKKKKKKNGGDGRFWEQWEGGGQTKSLERWGRFRFERFNRRTGRVDDPGQASHRMGRNGKAMALKI